MHGISYGNEYRNFNLFDYFTITSMPFDEFRYYSAMFNSVSIHEKVMVFLKRRFIGIARNC